MPNLSFEEVVKKTKEMYQLNTDTNIGDDIIIVEEVKEEGEEPRAAINFARVIDIIKDKKGGDWWNVKLAAFGIPIIYNTLTLRYPQYTGEEIFTINGVKFFIASIKFEEIEPEKEIKTPPKSKAKSRIKSKTSSDSNVISLKDRTKGEKL